MIDAEHRCGIAVAQEINEDKHDIANYHQAEELEEMLFHEM